MPGNNPDVVADERKRIRAEYERREREIDLERYASWSQAVILEQSNRKRIASMLLHQANVFPDAGCQCLEVGCGAMGWAAELLSWGVPTPNLHGIDLCETRIRHIRELLPQATFRVGDATELPWGTGQFQLVVASTVFTSILDQDVRRRLAVEIVRVMAPQGALLWYDFAFNSPGNPNVRRVDRAELRALFPQLDGEIKSITLAPPIARVITPLSWTIATCLQAVPLLRTHLIAVLVKPR